MIEILIFPTAENTEFHNDQIKNPVSSYKKSFLLTKKAFSDKGKVIRLFFVEKILDMIVVHYFLLGNIGSGFR